MGLFGPQNIEKLKAKKNINKLIKLQRNKSYSIKTEATNALIDLGKLAVGPLLKALEKAKIHEDKIIEVLGRIGDKRAVEPLIERLPYSRSHTQEQIIKVLIELKDERAIKPLVDILKKSDDFEIERISALALAKFKWKPTSEEEKVFYYSAKQEWDKLEDFGELAAGHLIRILKKTNLIYKEKEKTKIRNKIVYTLAKIGQPAVDPIYITLRSSYFKYKPIDTHIKFLLKALSEIKDDKAVKSFNKIVDDISINREVTDYKFIYGYDELQSKIYNNYHIRRAIAEALRKIGNRKALNVLRKIQYQNRWRSQDLAKEWWQCTNKSEGVCDWCTSPIKRKEGYLVKPMIAATILSKEIRDMSSSPDLICKVCWDKNPDTEPFYEDISWV
jgi:HEAT repeat protein